MASTAPDDTEARPAAGAARAILDASGYVRRARRLADMSQRDLAAAIGVGQPQISRIESGQDVGLALFVRILEAAGLRIEIVDDETEAAVAPMPPDVLRDRIGRRQPAHLDVHAAPELPIFRLLLRRCDPSPRPPWHHRRADRDRIRGETGRTARDEQLTLHRIEALRRERLTTRRPGASSELHDEAVRLMERYDPIIQRRRNAAQGDRVDPRIVGQSSVGVRGSQSRAVEG